MAIRVYKPTSPARRFMSVLTFEEITKYAGGEKLPDEEEEGGEEQAA